MIRFFFLLFCVTLRLHAAGLPPAVTKYNFKDEPIDVVIPCAEKDIPTLDLCIKAIKTYGHKIRRVIVVSDKRYTKKAEWFDEKKFPFSKLDVTTAIFNNAAQGKYFLKKNPERAGWIYAKLLKLYAAFIIPNISSNILVLDADVIFLRKIAFLHREKYGMFTAAKQYHAPYFAQMQKVLPWLTRFYKEYSGICYHMIFQRPVLKDLFKMIEEQHNKVAWKVLVRAIDKRELVHSSMSEWEMYFNFALARTDRVKLRQLRWKNISSFSEIKLAQEEGYDFVACHSYLRD